MAVTAAMVEMAAARLEAQRAVGDKYARLQAIPRHHVRAHRLARRDLRATERYWEEHLDKLWLLVVRTP